MADQDPLIPSIKYATFDTIGDGSTTSWEFNFAGGYISRDHVKAFTQDLVTGELRIISPLVFTGPNTVVISPAVPPQQRLVIYRDTPKTLPIVDYTEGSIINERNLDVSNLQSVFIAAELADRVVADYDFSNSLLYAVTTATSAAQVANAIDEKATAALAASVGAAQSSTLASATGSSFIGYLRAGVGAVLRTLFSKMDDLVSVKDFGAKGDGVTDDTDAIQKATSSGRGVHFPTGTYIMLGTVAYTGRVLWTCNGDVTLVSDKEVLIATSATNSKISNLRLVNATRPFIITRNDAGVITGGLHQDGPGYQPTVNDTEIWSTLTPAQQSQDIGPKLYFQGDASNIVIDGITGEFVSIMLLGATNSQVRNCVIRGGKNFGAAILFWNINGQRGDNNKATNNIVTYASFNAIAFARNYNGSATDNNVSYMGESGIKTFQNDAGGVDARCYRMLVDSNIVSFARYDGLDLATDYPITGSKDSRHIVTGNDVFGCVQTGLHIDGFNCTIIGNRFRTNGQNGVAAILNASKVSNNHALDNNTRNTPNMHHMNLVGAGNSIDGNFIVTNGRNGAAIYAPGTNNAGNNTSPDGAFFWGNVGSIGSSLNNNVDSLPTWTSTVAMRQRQNSTSVPALEVYTESGSLPYASISYHPRHNTVRNPSVRLDGYCSSAVDNNEYGTHITNVAIAGVMTEGFRVQGHSSLPGSAFPILSGPSAAINPAFLDAAGMWTVSVQATRLAISVRAPNGDPKMVYLPYA